MPATDRKTRAAVIGATGYVGLELIRLLRSHPNVELSLVVGHQSAGSSLAAAAGNFWGLEDRLIESFSADEVCERADVVFSALPHGAGSDMVAQLVERVPLVLDLSADLRLRDVDAIRRWYGEPAPAALRERAVYGLVELHREAISTASLIAVPGCYATTSILALAPLVKSGLVDASTIIVDAKSGASGAGRGLSLGTHFAEINDGIRAYKVAGAHRHIPEIEQELSALSSTPITLTFTPQLLPTTRGILVTAYASLAATADLEQCIAAATTLYSTSPFVHVLPADTNPDTAWIKGSNHVHVNYQVDARTRRVIAQATLDNLVKGAAGQAVQCMNVRQKWPEDAGLTHSGLFP